MGHSHDVKDSDANFTINPTTMEIVNNSAKNKMMQGDHNSEIYSFEITQIVEGHEMILCNEIRIHFINISSDKADQSKGVANAENIRIDSAKNMLVFEWKVSGDATKYQGSLNFRIEFACTDENNVRTYAKWTEIHKGITIGEGFDNAEGYIEEHKDILAQWKADLESEIKNYETLEKKIPTKMSQLKQDVELGSKAFIINVTGSGTEDDPYVSDKTFEEIKQAYQNNDLLEIMFNGNIKYLNKESTVKLINSSLSLFNAMPQYGVYVFAVSNINFFAYLQISSFSYEISINGGAQGLDDFCLTKDNVLTYTQTQDYHPATKKYVDDAVKGRRELVFECATNAKTYTGTMQESIVDCFENPDMDFEVEVYYQAYSNNYKIIRNKHWFGLNEQDSGCSLIQSSQNEPNMDTRITIAFSKNGYVSENEFKDGYHELKIISASYNVTSVKVYKITK